VRVCVGRQALVALFGRLPPLGRPCTTERVYPAPLVLWARLADMYVLDSLPP